MLWKETTFCVRDGECPVVETESKAFSLFIKYLPTGNFPINDVITKVSGSKILDNFTSLLSSQIPIIKLSIIMMIDD